MANKIQIKRGIKANLPTLDVGEFGLCTDTSELFLGTAKDGNINFYDSKSLKGTFSTFQELKSSKKLENGKRVNTLGYYEVNDGGAANYIIESTKKDWSLEIIENTLYANIEEPERVNYKQFGAYLDGVNDDYIPMYLCHKYADSIKTIDKDKNVYSYNCTVENHKGTIYKKNKDPIMCSSNVDLSGSSLLIDDTNAAWFGIYKWGDLDSLYWDYQIQDEMKAYFKADSYVLPMPSNDGLPPHAILKLEEIPYSVRDDAGYLYSVGRREILVHGVDGIFTSPFGDDWTSAGGEEINCLLTNLATSQVTSQQSFSTLKASYSYMANKVSKFTGCEVILNMSGNQYCSVLHAKNHNSIIKDFYFKPNPSNLHNTAFKNTMIYVFDSVNVRLKNIQGFNAAGKSNGNTKGTSGYAIRITNCSDVNFENCRLQGYWGATAMDSVKNVHFENCHLNRLDVHDYFYNLTAKNCTFYHHAIQIGYGRGLASFDNCSFYFNLVPNEPYPEAYAIALNLTYGRIFEGTLALNNCNIYVENAPNNQYSLLQMYFSKNATSIIKHFKFPEIRFKNLNIKSSTSNLEFSYVRIGGTRLAKTGIVTPTHVYGETMDNNVKWRFKKKAFTWGDMSGRSLVAEIGDYLKVSDTVLNAEGKTNFYNYRYYKCTAAGTMVWEYKPTKDQTTAVIGNAIFVKIDSPEWRGKKQYNVGETVVVGTSNFYDPDIYECITAGISNGYFPTHTTGTVLEGPNDTVNEPDLCWWKYIGNKAGMFTDLNTNTSYEVGTKLMAEGKLFEVIERITSTEYPPFETPWLKVFEYGGGKLRYIGNSWQPKKWFEKGSYCEANGNIYQLENHAGITSGVLPSKGNLYCVDGDLSWEYLGKVGTTLATTTYKTWTASGSFSPGDVLKASRRLYEVQPYLTGTAIPTATTVGQIYMDGTTPVKYYGQHKLAWRTAGAAYNVGDIISDNTFLCICTQAGTTNAGSTWGPLETEWGTKTSYTDGTCVWEKLTPTKADGVWRNGSRNYTVGKILIVSLSPNMQVFKVVAGTSGTITPTSTVVGQAFTDGTLTLKYTGEAVESNSWMANSKYNVGDIVTAGENQYKCAFDGRLELPNKSIFENITTNLTNGYIFKFDTVDVPTKKGSRDWTVIANYCEGLLGDVQGLATGINFFGGSNTINPTINKI